MSGSAPSAPERCGHETRSRAEVLALIAAALTHPHGRARAGLLLLDVSDLYQGVRTCGLAGQRLAPTSGFVYSPRRFCADREGRASTNTALRFGACVGLDLPLGSSALEPPERLTDVSSWHLHIPFAFWCVEALRPRLVVELGTHRGDSYCAFCQAVERLSLPTKCFAVDTWRGDKHSGAYGDDVLDELRAHHDARYGRFSRLLRATFDEAVAQFADGSIDLLHVDGLHTYEAVTHDFETWLPKLSRSAVVLFHDINVRERGFGVWRFWEEVSGRFPHFTFLHGHGLGVLVVGAEAPEPARRLAASGSEEVARVRRLFSGLGATVKEASEHHRLVAELAHRPDARGGAPEEVAADAARILEHQRARLAARETEILELQVQLDWTRTRAGELERRLESEVGSLVRELSSIRESRALAIGRVLDRLAQQVGHAARVGVLVLYWTATFQLRTGLRRRKYARLIRRSGLFQPEHYLAQVPESQTAAARKDPIWHFLEHGAAEGLDPNPFFDTSYYAERCPESARDGKNPLVHFIRTRGAGKCDPSPLFDTQFYLHRHSDVRSAGLNPLAHYLVHGAKEGRACASASESPPALRHASSEEARAVIARFQRCPVVSVVVPCYDTEPGWLMDAVASVREQFYSRWELILVDDASTSAATRAALAELVGVDPRIHVVWQERNGGISAATNAGLRAATGEFLALLDHDDRLTPDALFEVVRCFVERLDLDAVYTDQDKIDAEGRRYEPFFKPDWSPELFRGVMYVGHLLVVRRSVAFAVGGFDSRFDKVQDFEFMLRVSEKTDHIAHVPKVLYHWRSVPGSVARGTGEKSGIVELQAAAVAAHLARLGTQASVEPHAKLDHRVVVRRRAPADPPLVSIVIPTKDAPQHISRCLDSIYGRSSYPRFEVIVVDNGTTDERALAAIRKHPVRMVPFAERFNFSVANNRGVESARGEVLVLLNNDTEVIDADWLETLIAHLQTPGVGIVGPVLLYPDRSVQHAGVVLGFRGTADHVMRGFPEDSDGYAGSLSCTREVSAVTGACLAIRRADYLALGGLIDLYGSVYQDVDLCLRVRAQGRRILCVPGARLFHHESATRGSAYDFLDRALLLDAWGEVIERGDPYYNPNLTLERFDYSPRRSVTS
jgi:GT2 family glycosyltransferase